MRPSIATLILCEAHRSGLTWPQYAWMIHSYRLNDLYEFEGASEVCHESKIFEGVIVFQLAQEHNNFQSGGNIMQESNPFSILLHDAVWALAIVEETLSFHQFNATFHQFNAILPGHNIVPSNIYVYQSSNSTTNLLGIYNGTSKMLTNVNIGTFITGDLIVLQPGLSLYLICIPLLFFIFNTVLLVLYIKFQEDKNIKSTNFYLSLPMFLGTYIIALYTLLLLLFNLPHTPDLCKPLLCLSQIGFSTTLIQGPLLVKLLQVYQIFKVHVIRLKPSKYNKYIAPFVYIFLIMLPNIILIALWNIVDPYHRTFIHIESSGTLVIITFCTSNHRILWIALAVVYNLLVYLALSVVAVKTRKIRLALFKDMKKVNLLIYIICFVGLSSYWIMFTFLITDYHNLRLYTLFVGHIMEGLAVQFTLFLPKVWPPFSKKSIEVLKSVRHFIK